MRIKMVTDYKDKSKGQIIDLSPNEAFGLIDSGKAILTKDMTEQDYKVKALDEEQANGKPTKLRPN